MKSNKINSQTYKNADRLKAYKKKMALWVLIYGITHRAIELNYFGTSSLKHPKNQTFEPLDY